MRLFSAITLSDDIRDNIWRLVKECEERDAKVKWVRRENLHITLKFYGEIKDEKEIEGIKDVLRKVAEENNARPQLIIELMI